MDSNELLSAYVSTGSGAAFTELVRRHIALVHSAALRKVGGDAHLACDVCQLVFTDLALKAQLLPPRVVLAGWLHHHTCYRAATAVRGERRRRAREQEAATMKMIEDTSDETWNHLGPLLDDALEHLPARDRNALLLRYFEGKNLAETGQALGLTDDAAQKRVSRATEKLRAYFARRGVTTGSAALATILATNAVRAAPLGLEVTTARLALETVAAMPIGTALLYKVLVLFMKHKTTSALAGLAVIAAIITVTRWPELNARTATPPPTASPVQLTTNNSHPTNPPLPTNIHQPPPITDSLNTDHLSANEVLERMAKVYATCHSYLDSGVVKTKFIRPEKNWTTTKYFRTAFVWSDRFRYEGWETVLKQEQHYIVWSQGKDIQTYWDPSKPKIRQPTSLSLAVIGTGGGSSRAARAIPSLLLPDQIIFHMLTSILNSTREKNEMVDGIDCIRIKGLSRKDEITLWLDKTTLLVRRVYEEADHSSDGFRAQTTTTYSPVLNSAIPDKLLQFDPPTKSDAATGADQTK